MSTCRGCGSLDSGMISALAMTPTMTNGTLIRKTEPHQNCSSRAPPVIGPIAMAMPETPAQMPIARPRSRGSNTLVMIDSVDGSDRCAADSHQRAGGDQHVRARSAKADAIEPIAEHDKTDDEHPLRPSRSPRTPKVNSSPAKARV